MSTPSKEYMSQWREKNRKHLREYHRQRYNEDDVQKASQERWRKGVGKEKVRAQAKRCHEKQQALKRSAMEILGGAMCANCGCDEIDCLEINHKEGGGNAARKGGAAPARRAVVL